MGKILLKARYHCRQEDVAGIAAAAWRASLLSPWISLCSVTTEDVSCVLSKGENSPFGAIYIPSPLYLHVGLL
jgi:hypothetical protein